MSRRNLALSRFWRSLSRLVFWPMRVAEARREFALLAGLDDRGLADMGLTRQDLRDATAFPLSERPSSCLTERAREREAQARARRGSGCAPRSIAAE